MPHPSEIERLEGLGQLAARDALRVRDPSCPALPDAGPNHLWPEIQALTKERDELRMELVRLRDGFNARYRQASQIASDAYARLDALTARVQDLESQLATARTLAADWQRLANVYRERISRAFTVPDDGA